MFSFSVGQILYLPECIPGEISLPGVDEIECLVYQLGEGCEIWPRSNINDILILDETGLSSGVGDVGLQASIGEIRKYWISHMGYYKR